MTRKSWREIETDIEELTPSASRSEYVRQAAAVLRGDRADTEADPDRVDIELVIAVARQADETLTDAWSVVKETAETPPPLADFTTDAGGSA